MSTRIRVLVFSLPPIAHWRDGLHGRGEQAAQLREGACLHHDGFAGAKLSAARAGRKGVDRGFYLHELSGGVPADDFANAQVEQQVKGESDVQLVSFSVDPEHDTPPVLNEFAHRFGGPTEQWIFLTGSPATVHLIAYQTFHVGDVIGKIEHSTKFVIVDKGGNIRGYYSSLGQDDIAAMLKDVEDLAESEIVMPFAFFSIHDLPIVERDV